MQVGGLKLFLGAGFGIKREVNQNEHLILREIVFLPYVTQDHAVLLRDGVAGVDQSKGFICIIKESFLCAHTSYLLFRFTVMTHTGNFLFSSLQVKL